VLGFYTGSTPPSTVKVFLYADATSLPGTELFNQDVTATNGPNYAIPIAGAPTLTPGTYWLSVQQTGATYFSADWLWEDRSTVSGNPAAFRNPGDGYGSGCTDWGVKATCLGAGTEPEQLFKLSGTSASYPPVPAPSQSPAVGDVSPPNAALGKRPPKKTTKRRAKFTFSSNEPGSTFKCKVDKKAFATCSSPFSRKVKPGKHRFQVEAIDAAGNVDPTPAAYTWKVLPP
jgi:hypothetical protein